MNVGDRVVVDGMYTGTVKYVGKVGAKQGPSVGIELDTPNGDNNGMRAGRAYFKCSSRHGVFREAHQIKKYCPSEYNQTNIIDTRMLPVVEELHNQHDKRAIELLEENMQIQRMLEELQKENGELKQALEREKRKVSGLERTVKLLEPIPETKFAQAPFNTSFNEVVFSDTDERTPQAIILDLVKEIRAKIETETHLFTSQ
ncbi:hypothetical protein NEDG_00338 [Nematocida displodere]|uniref:CAP-Gly domain-containing protein n=1 Tax=Nematocida displodere TaxID=1805483 RepID=A0A177EIS2_9MICR|nr:hypothetical protein NEDG_00338 [Nematocida displodere]